ncbi:MAG: DUF3572 family protein [Alphaproteobacteria bacterium]|nr:MAG: DUF3572 family protein [Alphaproteobacteria bacterium]
MYFLEIKSGMNLEQSEILALKALTYIAGDEKALSWLMAETGLGPADLLRQAENPETLAGVLDFLLGHENILIDFCNAEGMDSSQPARARRYLPGAPDEEFY